MSRIRTKKGRKKTETERKTKKKKEQSERGEPLARFAQSAGSEL